MKLPASISMAAPVEIEAAAAPDKPKAISMVAYTGGQLRVAGWPHPVVVDLAGMSGADRSRPILKNHDLNAIVGHTTTIRVDGRSINVMGLLSGTGPAAEEVKATSGNGFPWQASIGARVETADYVRERETVIVNGQNFSGPIYVARRSILGEISFVPLGADDRTSANVAATQRTLMDSTTPIVTPTTPVPAAEDEQLSADRQRTASIIQAAAKYPSSKAGDIQAQAVREGWNAEKAELHLLRASRPIAAPVGFVRGAAADGPSDGAVIEAALCLSAGLSEKFVGTRFDERTVHAATAAPYRGLSLHGLLRYTLRAAGRSGDFERVTPDVIREAFEADRNLRASGFSSISLPGILGNTLGKSMLESYSAVPTTWQTFCRAASNADFKQHTRYRLVGDGSFTEVAPTGELKHVTLQEQSYTSQLATNGAMISITRQMLINDDLGALTAMPRLIGRMGAIALEKAVYTLLLSNPSSFFANGNGNYLSGASSALGISSLSTAEQKFLEQTDDNDDPAMIVPKTLLVPPALSATAAVLTRSLEIRNTADDNEYPVSNPHVGKFLSAVSPWLSNAALTGYSTTGWYLFGPADDTAALEVAFLNGQQSPTVESGDTSFETLGMQIRGYWDFGVAMLDKRGGVFSAGA